MVEHKVSSSVNKARGGVEQFAADLNRNHINYRGVAAMYEGLIEIIVTLTEDAQLLRSEIDDLKSKIQMLEALPYTQQ